MGEKFIRSIVFEEISVTGSWASLPLGTLAAEAALPLSWLTTSKKLESQAIGSWAKLQLDTLSTLAGLP